MEKRFESGDPRMYTHCQACGESVEGQKACWSYGQYHRGKCYDMLFADCIACGKHCMDAKTNTSPGNHLHAEDAIQLCDHCFNERRMRRLKIDTGYKDKNGAPICMGNRIRWSGDGGEYIIAFSQSDQEWILKDDRPDYACPSLAGISSPQMSRVEIIG